MGIFNAWCDRQPMLILGATGPVDATLRRPNIDWLHTAQDQGQLIRNFVKYDDQPGSAAAIPESILRAWQQTATAPHGPTYVCLDATIQEGELEEEAEAVARQEPSHGGAKRPKILYATQGATPPPTVVLFARNADQVHFTWQRYLENQLRERYPLQGTPVRIVVRERAAEEGRERGRSGGRRR